MAVLGLVSVVCIFSHDGRGAARPETHANILWPVQATTITEKIVKNAKAGT